MLAFPTKTDCSLFPTKHALSSTDTCHEMSVFFHLSFVQILVHVVNIQSIKFLKRSVSWKQAACPGIVLKGQKRGGKAVPACMEHCAYLLRPPPKTFFSLLDFQLGRTLWETAGGQAGHENLGLTLHGECVPTASLCLVA